MIRINLAQQYWAARSTPRSVLLRSRVSHQLRRQRSPKWGKGMALSILGHTLFLLALYPLSTTVLFGVVPRQNSRTSQGQGIRVSFTQMSSSQSTWEAKAPPSPPRCSPPQARQTLHLERARPLEIKPLSYAPSRQANPKPDSARPNVLLSFRQRQHVKLPPRRRGEKLPKTQKPSPSPSPSSSSQASQNSNKPSSSDSVPSRGQHGSSRAPVSIDNPPPHYPRLARLRGYEGRVLLQVEVDPTGKPRKVEVLQSSGYSILDRAAKEAVSRWRFQPALRFGRPVSATIQIPIRFELSDE